MTKLNFISEKNLTKLLQQNNNTNTIDYSKHTISHAGINIPTNPEEIVIQKDFLEFIAASVKKIDKEEPEKNYLHIYTLRYDKGMTQKEISEELGISQSEISKRLFKLMEKVKDVIE